MIARRAALAGFALAVSGCAGNSDLGFIEQVEEAVRIACGFVPLISTIVAIIGLHDSTLQTTQQIADAICAALGRARSRGALPVVKGDPRPLRSLKEREPCRAFNSRHTSRCPS